MRGLQYGANRNKRVVSFWTITVPEPLPLLKPKETETMNLSVYLRAPARCGGAL